MALQLCSCIVLHNNCCFPPTFLNYYEISFVKGNADQGVMKQRYNEDLQSQNAHEVCDFIVQNVQCCKVSYILSNS